MTAFNPLDPLGIGVAIGFSGQDASAPSDYTRAFSITTDPSVRRKAVSQIIAWLEQNRSAQQPTHTYDTVLMGVKLDHIDQTARNELYKDLKVNIKINAPDAEHISYRATHSGLYNINDLSAYLQRFTYGMPAEELADAYAGVKEDIETLIASKAIYSINHVEKKKQILFPSLTEFDVNVDADLRDMWHSVVMPKTQVELEEKLHAAGHLSETQYRAGHLEKSRLMQAQIKLAAGQKALSQAERRAKRRRYPQKLTNTHMIGQYDWFTQPGKAGAAPAAASSSAAPK